MNPGSQARRSLKGTRHHHCRHYHHRHCIGSDASVGDLLLPPLPPPLPPPPHCHRQQEDLYGVRKHQQDHHNATGAHAMWQCADVRTGLQGDARLPVGLSLCIWQRCARALLLSVALSHLMLKTRGRTSAHPLPTMLTITQTAAHTHTHTCQATRSLLHPCVRGVCTFVLRSLRGRCLQAAVCPPGRCQRLGLRCQRV